MNLYRQTLPFLLAAALLTILSGCVSEHRVDASISQMTGHQAKAALVKSLKSIKDIETQGWSMLRSVKVRELKFTRDGITFVGESNNGETCDYSIMFQGMKKLKLITGAVSGAKWSEDGSMWPVIYFFKNDSAAKMFVDAVLTLKAAALAPDTEEDADFAAFNASAQTWLSATPKPEMSDEARAYKVLAEDAFERKNFPAALDAYGKALDKYPMWPKGQFNAALLAAEAEDYELAAHHMRRYLVLSPDAKDAKAAKDKLLLWQLKAKE